MSKEKRLGRGLEALLGRLAVASDATSPAESTSALPAARPLDAALAPHAAEPLGPPFFQHHAPQVQSLVERPLSSQTVIPDSAPAATVAPAPQSAADAAPAERSGRVAIALIDANPFQPRREFDAADIQTLADSLASHGLLQPIVVRRAGQRFQVVVGERRLRAAGKAGWTDVPVQIVEVDDRQTAELAIVENLHRKDLNALEKAASFERYIEQYGCTQEELAGRLQLDRSTIANLIRLLELPEPVQDAIRKGGITPGHARALLPLGDEREQVEFCQRIEREGLSVRQTESLVQEVIDRTDAEPLAVLGREGETKRRTRGQSEHLSALEQEFHAALGLKVALRHNARGRGRLVIHFRNHEEFDRLRQDICGGRDGELETRAG